MTVTWILERDVFSTACYDRMIDYFKTKNIPYHTIRVVPFIHEIEGKVPIVEGPVVVYGSIGAQKLAAKHGWTPGVWTDDRLSEANVMETFWYQYLNDDAIICKFSEVLDKTDLDVFFIKPNSDTKEFAGTVMDRDEFFNWTTTMLEMGYFDTDIFDIDVVVSKPKNIGCEWRFVIVDGEVADYSVYRQYQQVKPQRWVPDNLLHIVDDMVKNRDLPPVYVIDICECPDEYGYYKVIELNTFNSAGLYECDVGNIIDRINEYLEK